ncbi:hypothetical protein COOONC_18756 [Cooperia oncophora]
MIRRTLQMIKDSYATPSTSKSKKVLSFDSGKEIVQCKICKRWMQPMSLLKHSTRYHAEEKKCEYYITCPLCTAKVRFQEDLVKHCRTVHDDEDCVVHTQIFKGMKEYEAWKESLAKAYCTAWLNIGRNRNSVHEITYYRCSRVHSTRRRAKKLLPETQYGYCTSFLNEYVYSTGTVFVKYCVRHISHDVSAACLPLTKKDREIIESFLERSTDEENVRDLIREKYNDPSTRLYWIRPEDIKRAMSSLAWRKRKHRLTGSTPCEASAADDGSEKSSSPLGFYDDPFIPSEALEEEPSSSHSRTTDNLSPCDIFDNPFIPSAEDLEELPDSYVDTEELPDSYVDTADRLLSSCSSNDEHFLPSAEDSEGPSSSNIVTADSLLETCDSCDDSSIPAEALIKEPSTVKTINGRHYEESKADMVSILSVESDTPGTPDGSVITAESLLGCSSCTKLKKRVAELQATADMLKKKLSRVSEPALFDNLVVKEEGS